MVKIISGVIFAPLVGDTFNYPMTSLRYDDDNGDDCVTLTMSCNLSFFPSFISVIDGQSRLIGPAAVRPGDALI